MSTPKDLNNSVVIPARNVREYSANSLAKNNAIGKVNISNVNFLRSREEKERYVFASIDSISGSGDSEWISLGISEKKITLSGTKPNEETETYLVLSSEDTQNKKTLRITGQVVFQYTDYNDRSYTQTFDKYLLVDGDTKELSKTFSFAISDTVTKITLFLSYNQGSLTARSKIERNMLYGFKSWSCIVTINSAEVIVSENLSGTITNSKGQPFVLGVSTASLSDNNIIFTVPQPLSESIKTDRRIYATCSYSVRNATLEETDDNYITNVDEAYVSILTPAGGYRLFNDYQEFVSYCQNDVTNTTSSVVLFIGLSNKIYKPWDRSFRFENPFDVYTCVMQAQSDTLVIENVSVKFWTRESASSANLVNKAYFREEQVFSSGFASNDNNEFSITGNSLFQEKTKYGEDNQSIESIISTNIVNRFKNGRNTTSVSIFYDKYLDLDGSTVYNGVDGYFPKVDDIITPYTIRTQRGADLPIEVPLYTENYITNQDGSQSAVGKQFYVTSCSLEYDGDFRIELEAIEKTD